MVETTSLVDQIKQMGSASNHSGWRDNQSEIIPSFGKMSDQGDDRAAINSISDLTQENKVRVRGGKSAHSS